MLSPIGRVTPGARNLSQASIKLMEQTKPAQKKQSLPESLLIYSFYKFSLFSTALCFIILLASVWMLSFFTKSNNSSLIGI